MPDPLASFSEPVRAWFLDKFGEPTEPQTQGWPAIQRGENTLILAPTGSGKTLAAFLWGVDRIYQELSAAAAADEAEAAARAAAGPIERRKGRRSAASSPRGLTAGTPHASTEGLRHSSTEGAPLGLTEGVRLLYISPLKALNNDIERNLRVPIEGIRGEAARLGRPGLHMRVAVRTGDTPGSARAQMVKHPPHILITTPESLYLILTSPRARQMLRTVQTVIVDEIHTLCGNKRGVHLALTLERLEELVRGAGAEEQTLAPLRGAVRGSRGAEGRGSDAGRTPSAPLPLREASLWDPSPTGAPPPLRTSASLQRIGLSATQRPLDEVARFLGGQEWTAAGELAPRPVTVVDTGYRKPLDLRVVTVVDDFSSLPGNTIWPSVIANLLGDIRRHRTTLVFANNRRLAERTADRLNAQLAAEESEEIPPGSVEALAPGGIVRDRGMFGIGAEGPIRAHHGSMSKEARRKMEDDLKAGRLPALVGTSSLELGIDIGTVDLVAQLGSPKSVSQGLQRVGRSGHLVGQTSKGRIYATFREDLVEAAAVAHGMLEGAIELTYTPQNALDVLAQQVVAMVAADDWEVPDLYRLVRRAYPYHQLSERAFRSVLDMLAGKYYNASLGGTPRRAAPEGASLADGAAAGEQPAVQAPGPALAALRARLVWDHVHNRLAALPGARMLAISNAGTIPDSGAYSVYLADGQTRVGELDEEFVFETRPGDAFLFGSQVWRVLEIGDDRMLVAPAPGSTPRMPFWNGDYPWRPYELGIRIGQFRGEIARRVAESMAISQPGAPGDQPPVGGAAPPPIPLARTPPALLAWLRDDYVLDANSAHNLVAHVRGQLEAVGIMSSERVIVAEFFKDAVDETRLVLHSPFGGRVNGAWAIALRSALRDQLPGEPEITANDDGILFRFPQLSGPPPLHLITAMTPQEARERVLAELPHSAVFGAQFRMAAGRALLLPRARGRKRTPFWLQRLKAKDLLAAVRRFGDFPLVVEAYRACLQDVLDLAHLEEVLGQIQVGTIAIVPVETAAPSPIAGDLLFNFMNTYMYEWDVPKAERDLQTLALRRSALSDVLAAGADLSHLLRPQAAAEVVAEMQHRAPGYQARNADELAVFMEELGDLTTAEVLAVCVAEPGQARAMAGGAAGTASQAAMGEVSTAEGQGARWLRELAESGRISELAIPTAGGDESRWAPAGLADEYRQAFGLPAAANVRRAAGAGQAEPDAHAESAEQTEPAAARDRVLRRYLRQSGPVTPARILARYAFPAPWLTEALARLVEANAAARGRFTPETSDDEYCDLGLLETIHRRTIGQLRREVQPVPLAAYAAFLARWQRLAPAGRLIEPDAPARVMGQLRGLSLPLAAWEEAVLPARLPGFSRAELRGELAALASGGGLAWAAAGSDAQHARLRFFLRGEGHLFLNDAGAIGDSGLSPAARTAYDFLRAEGASFSADLRTGTGLRGEALAAALSELALAGLVTNDSLAALAAALAAGGPRPEAAEAQDEEETQATGQVPASRPRAASSTLAADLAERMAGRSRRLTHTRYREAKREARRRVIVAAAPGGAPAAQTAAPVATQGRGDVRRTPGDIEAGRWALVHRPGILGPALAPDELAARQAEVLLARYGIVTRDCLAHEDGPFDWALLYGHLQRLEMRGEVRRGYFVAGLAGAQFALPAAVEELRAAAAAPGDDLVVLNAVDPANIYGGELLPAGQEAGGTPGGQLRFARIVSTEVVLWRGRPVLLAEDHGARLSAPADVSQEVVRRGLQAYLDRPGARRHVVVATWNGRPVWGMPGEGLLKSLGFYRSPGGMEWWRNG